MPMAVTKQDLPEVRASWPAVAKALRADGGEPIAVSAHDGSGLDALRGALDEALAVALADEAARPVDAPVRLHRFDPLDAGWQVDGRGRCAARSWPADRGRPPRGSTSRTTSHATDSSARWNGWASTPSCAGWALARAPWSASGASNWSGARTSDRPARASPRRRIRRHEASARPRAGARRARPTDRSGSASWAAPSTRRTSVTCGWPALAADAMQLDRVIFMPAAQPPHKQGRSISPIVDRLLMTRLAIGGE